MILLPAGGLDAALVGELLAVVPVAVDDVGEVVVELAAGGQVRDDLFVFQVGGFEPLEGLFARAGRGGVAFAGEEEGLVRAAQVLFEGLLGGFFAEEHFAAGGVALETGFEEEFELDGFDFLHGVVALQAGCLCEDGGVLVLYISKMGIGRETGFLTDVIFLRFSS